MWDKITELAASRKLALGAALGMANPWGRDAKWNGSSIS
jgi:hypothetical protein